MSSCVGSPEGIAVIDHKAKTESGKECIPRTPKMPPPWGIRENAHLRHHRSLRFGMGANKRKKRGKV